MIYGILVALVILMFLTDLHLRVDSAVHMPSCLAYNIIVTFFNLKLGN